MGPAASPTLRGGPPFSVHRPFTQPPLSSNSVVGQRMTASFGIEFPDGIVDGLIEVVRSGEDLVGEGMPLQVAPDPFNVDKGSPPQAAGYFRREPIGGSRVASGSPSPAS